MTPRMVYDRMTTPVGELLLTGDGRALTRIAFPGRGQPSPGAVRCRSSFDEVRRQLHAYFRGELRVFDLPLAPRGTSFQRSVWEAVREVPFGETVSYGELARRLGRPRAGRAVGAANGRNPLPLVVPCHRVIGSGGALTGFGGGLPLKRWLLDHESAIAGRRSGQRSLFGSRSAGGPVRGHTAPRQAGEP